MATSTMAALSRRVGRSFFLTSKPSQHILTADFSTELSSPKESDSLNAQLDCDIDSVSDSDSSSPSPPRRAVYDQCLENGLDIGIYKALLVGQVGQSPMQKTLKNGRSLTMFSLATGGIRNNRRPFNNEEPREYANRCSLQWHRVCVYPYRLGETVMKHVAPSSILYLEGNLETKIFTDPITGLVRRLREIAIRGNGRIVFLGKDGSSQTQTEAQMKGVGYY